MTAGALDRRGDQAAAASDACGPRGCRLGDMVVAEGSRWRVVGLDLERHEAVCALIVGARVLHRFRARQIMSVVRDPGGSA